MTSFRILIRFIWIACLCCSSNWLNTLYAQGSIQYSIDTCVLTIQYVDSAGNIAHTQPPYLLEIEGQVPINNNALAYWRVDMSQTFDGTKRVQITDGNGTVFQDSSLVTTCGIAPPVFNAQAINIRPATNCSTCDGSITVAITNPTTNSYLFDWSNGVFAADTASTITNLCAGNYMVIVRDTQNNRRVAVPIDLGCGTPASGINCVSRFEVYLNQSVRSTPLAIYPQDVVLNTTITAGQYHWQLPSGLIEPFYTVDCDDVGYHRFQAIVQDTATFEQAQCSVLIHVVDSTGNACSPAAAPPLSILDTIVPASNCVVCDGSYGFAGLVDSVTGSIHPGPFIYQWNDGSTAPSRSDLCPNQTYTFTVWDSFGIATQKNIRLSCIVNSCEDSTTIDPTLSCPSIYIPVCGCDGRTYVNSCVAQYEAGLISWTNGPCPNIAPLRVEVRTTADAPCMVGPCSGSIFLNVTGGIGQYTYTWSDSTITGFSQTGICNGTYMVTVSDSTGVESRQVVVVGQQGCVWPGDADENGVANHYDVLYMGLAQGQTGPLRLNATTRWVGQSAQDWNTNIIGTNTNSKHSDADGNGSVDSLDAQAIRLNYGQYYARSGNNSPPGNVPLYAGTVRGFAGDTVAVPIYLGDSTDLATDVYGVAMTLHYDERYLDLVPQPMRFNNSWLGTPVELLKVYQGFGSQGKVEVGMSRINLQPVTGAGQIGTLWIVIKDDVIMRETGDDSIVSPVAISGALVINEMNQPLGINTRPGAVQLDESLYTRKIPHYSIDVYPNPARGTLYIESDQVEMTHVTLYSATGQLVREQAVSQGQRLKLSTQDMPEGIYLLQIQTAEGLWQQKVHIAP